MAEQNISEPRVVKIILSNSDRAQYFQPENLVHQEEFDLTVNLIRRGLKLAIDDPDRAYLHDTITLLGSRGSGKTSFLLSIKNWIDKFHEDSKYTDLNDIQVLSIIDPTLVEEKGHVFLNVIALIQELVERKIEKEECQPASNESTGLGRKEWQSVLHKLAAGLPSIDGVGSYSADNWQDPEFVMDNGLKAVAASQKLAKNFNELLKISLKILNKKAFLLIFDDIDVDSTKGWTVLETIRKYFTGARLITLISGDLELYTKVVRQKKWVNFGSEIVRYEGELTEGKKGLEEFRALVTKLAAQYMLKIMQPQFRVHLNTLLYKKVINRKLEIEIAYDDGDTFKSIEDIYKVIFQRYGIINEVQVEVFRTYLLNQPLRSQIQFLLVAMARGNESKVIDNSAIADIFLSDLLEMDVDITVGSHSPKFLVIIILRLLIANQKLEDLYQLQPTTTDESLNATLFTLNILLSNTIKNNNRFIIFEYLIKVGYLRNLITIIPYHNYSTNNSNTVLPSIEDICERSGLFNDGVLRDVTGKMQSYLYGAIELDGMPPDISAYFIQLKALKFIVKQASANDRIDAVFAKQGVSKAERLLAYIPCYVAAYSYKNESRINYSVYMLLAAIGEIVKEYETVHIETQEDATKSQSLKRLLQELSQLRSYPIIAFSKKQLDAVERETIFSADLEPGEEDEADLSDDILCEQILEWLKSSPSVAMASHLLGKIATRFFFAMNNIAEASTKDLQLGELVHRQVVAFMNAVLIEDVRENLEGRISRINLNNTNTDDSTFIKNLNSLIGPRKNLGHQRLKFSKWLLQCPLLLGYLKSYHDDRLREALYAYTTNVRDHNQKVNFSINHLLNEVAIRSREDGMLNSSSYRVVKGNPQMLRDPQALANLLRASGIPYEWFLEGDRGEAGRRNDLIKQYVSSVFSNTKAASPKIRSFRKAIKKLGIKW